MYLYSLLLFKNQINLQKNISAGGDTNGTFCAPVVISILKTQFVILIKLPSTKNVYSMQMT